MKLKALFLEENILGAQVAVIHRKKLVVDTCVGKMGPTDARPVCIS